MYGPLLMAARFEDEPRERWHRHFAAIRLWVWSFLLKKRQRPCGPGMKTVTVKNYGHVGLTSC